MNTLYIKVLWFTPPSAYCQACAVPGCWTCMDDLLLFGCSQTSGAVSQRCTSWGTSLPKRLSLRQDLHNGCSSASSPDVTFSECFVASGHHEPLLKYSGLCEMASKYNSAERSPPCERAMLPPVKALRTLPHQPDTLRAAFEISGWNVTLRLSSMESELLEAARQDPAHPGSPSVRQRSRCFCRALLL